MNKELIKYEPKNLIRKADKYSNHLENLDIKNRFTKEQYLIYNNFCSVSLQEDFLFDILRFYPLSEKFLDKMLEINNTFEYEYNWFPALDACNDNINWTIEFIKKYTKITGFVNIGKGKKGINTFLNFFELYSIYPKSKVNFLQSLSSNLFVNWNVNLIENYSKNLNWDELCKNSSIQWTKELIIKFENKINWEALSQNIGIVWSIDLIDTFLHKWYWGKELAKEDIWRGAVVNIENGYKNNNTGLSANPSLPWCEGLIERYKSYWDWSDLCTNPFIPWSQIKLSKYEQFLNYSSFSYNPSLDWTMEFIDLHIEKWDWKGLSINPSLPWSIFFISKYFQFLNWLGLTFNLNFWSVEIYKRHSIRCSPYLLVQNINLPWSIELFSDIIERGNKGDNTSMISINEGVPWSEEYLFEFKDDLSMYRLASNLSFPWTLELIEKYNLGFAFDRCASLKRNYDILIKPHINDDLIFEMYKSFLNKRKAFSKYIKDNNIW
jgi:hypothetical protein